MDKETMKSEAALPPGVAMPNFFLIGAAKCGTTSMAKYLSEHPDIYISHPKEPNYFNSDFSDKYRIYTDWDKYLKECFIDSDSFLIRGDCTVWHLYSDVAIERILKRCPNSKFMVMIRQPIDLLQSLHSQLMYGNNEDVADLAQAWALQEDRKAGRHIPATCTEPKLLQYGRVCRLGAQLERAIRLIPTDRLKVVFFEDFIRDTAKSYEEVLDYLELKNQEEMAFVQHNSRKENRSVFVSKVLQQAARLPIRSIKDKIGIPRGKALIPVLRNLNTKKSVKQELDPVFIRQLLDYFDEDITLIEKLTGRDLTHWKKKPMLG